MALNGVDVSGVLSWTRGEFADLSTTHIYEGTTSSFDSAALVAKIPSSVVSHSFTKNVTLGTTLTRYYWVRHAIGPTLGTLVGPVTGTYTGLN